MYSDFNIYRPITETQGITDKTAKAPSHARTIIIFAAGGDTAKNDYTKALDQQCRAASVSSSHMPINDAAGLPATMSAMRRDGTIGDGSQILLDLHGGIGKDRDGKVDLKLASASDSQDEGSALEVLHEIRKPLDGSNQACAATVYITACHSGSQDFVNRVQDLHNLYKAGVCFLLSSKAVSLTASCNAALKTVCEEFISANRCDGNPPTTEHLWALLMSEAVDCVSMVVANEAHPRRVHGMEAMSDAGSDAVIDRLDRSALIFLDDKTTCLGLTSTETGPFEKYTQVPKRKEKPYTISGDLSGLKASKESLEALKRAGRKTEISRDWFFRKISRSSDRETLEKLIAGEPEFAALKGADWSEAHDRVVDLLTMANDDENKQRRDEKVEYLARFIHSGLQQNDRYRFVLNKLLPRLSDEVLRNLNRMGLFIKHGGDLRVIQPICEDMAKRPGGLEHLKIIFNIVPENIFPNPDRKPAKDRPTFGEILIMKLASEKPFPRKVGDRFLRELKSSAPGQSEIFSYLGEHEEKAVAKLAAEADISILKTRVSELPKPGEHLNLMLSALIGADKDVVAERRAEKINWLSKEIILNTDSQITLAAKRVFTESPQLFDALNNAGFFFKTSDQLFIKVGPLALFLVEHSDLKSLKDLMERKFADADPPSNASRTAGEIWSAGVSEMSLASVIFSLQILESAEKNPNANNRNEIAAYIIGIIRDAGSWQDRTDRIWSLCSRAVGERLYKEGVIGPRE
ncbi:MAG: hypothetical protein ACR652_15485 [Methylocystis sp.]|uniref:hypothetical protein n=1 Tax=Methylocystis sp. TaxID=1911079 RepID=UPI003DA4C694